MELQLLNGKVISQKIRTSIKGAVSTLTHKPGLAVVTIGNDPASKVYVRNKEEACREVGFIWKQVALSENVSEQEVLSVIHRLDEDPDIHGILVQVPIPSSLKNLEEKIIYAIDPSKDVDVFHPFNIGKYVGCRGPHCDMLLLPCTPYGIVRLLEEYRIPIARKHVVIMGRSNLIGKPVSLLFLARDATVTVCHTKTANIAQITRQADILVVAIGKPNSIDASYVKDGVVIVDVGINWLGKSIVGDVDYESVKSLASAITPVPGGIGPMTIAMLLENVLKAYRSQTITP